MTLRDYISKVLTEVNGTPGYVVDLEIHLDANGNVNDNGTNIVRLSILADDAEEDNEEATI